MMRVEELALLFCKGEYDHKVDDYVWADVFRYIVDNAGDLSFDKDLIHDLWTVSGGHLRRKVANDDLILSVLLNALPGYNGEGLTLYRGECRLLYNANKIGFCWTPKLEVAEMFASGLNAIESGGVLLTAYAESSAIISSPNEHSANFLREYEYTCNPKLLTNIRALKTY